VRERNGARLPVTKREERHAAGCCWASARELVGPSAGETRCWLGFGLVRGAFPFSFYFFFLIFFSKRKVDIDK